MFVDPGSSEHSLKLIERMAVEFTDPVEAFEEVYGGGRSNGFLNRIAKNDEKQLIKGEATSLEQASNMKEAKLLDLQKRVIASVASEVDRKLDSIMDRITEKLRAAPVGPGPRADAHMKEATATAESSQGAMGLYSV